MPNARHFWTTDPNGELLDKNLWIREGVACWVLSNPNNPQSTALWRFYSSTAGKHFWTTDPNGELLPKNEYVREGPACYVLQAQVNNSVPFLRWYSGATSTHFWTVDPNGELLPKPEYALEGQACHVYSQDIQGASLVPLYRFYKVRDDIASSSTPLPYFEDHWWGFEIGLSHSNVEQLINAAGFVVELQKIIPSIPPQVAIAASLAALQLAAVCALGGHDGVTLIIPGLSMMPVTLPR